MRTLFIPFLVLLFGSFSMNLSSCAKEKVPLPELVTTCADTVGFQNFVLPLITTNCSTSGCHDAAGAASGYVLETHAQVSSNAAVILSTIRHESNVSAMPQNQAKLADSLATKLNCWIQQGKLNN